MDRMSKSVCNAEESIVFMFFSVKQALTTYRHKKLPVHYSQVMFDWLVFF